MFYYAYLDSRDIVQAIYAMPSPLEGEKYVSIPTNDQTLIGKRYNRQTGKFEDVVMFYYAVLGAKDIVTEVISSETEIIDPNKIRISTSDTTLIGKWYNRGTGQFLNPPIHILAELSTGQINIVGQDKWLQTELNEIRASLVELGYGSIGGYKCTFDMEENQETTNEWTSSGSNTGKNYIFSFDTGIPGYFPKMIRIVSKYFDNDLLVADFYIVRNADGSVKYAYVDKNYFGISRSSTDTAKTRWVAHNIKMSKDDVFAAGKHSNGRLWDEGGGVFFQEIGVNNSDVSIGKFNYTENTFSFTMEISSNLVGNFTDMNLRGYVF